MKNKFYTEFDTERVKESKRTDDYRSPFQIDRDRVIHSSEFRRLQGKTQVFLPGEYDYYRTRLTHSIEVAQIGRSICNYLKNKKDSPLNDEFYIDPDLVEAACLAHDLGNPPFGHAGERTINRLMKEFGGFEGNAQTLRLLTEIFYRDGKSKRGMNPTRALIDGVLKYKQLHKEFNDPLNHFIYNEQQHYLDFVFDGNEVPQEIRSDFNNFKSIECQIMDWADDSAYAINDLVDSISGGFLTIARIKNWASQKENELSDYQKSELEKVYRYLEMQDYKAKFGSLIGECIEACRLEEQNNFMSSVTNRYKYKLIIDGKIKERVKLFKRISIELVFQSPQLHQMEFKGNSMIERIFKVLVKNYVTDQSDIKLLPGHTDNLIKSEKNSLKKIRLICDYISGMTDGFAIRTYKRLFDPDYSSLIDFV